MIFIIICYFVDIQVWDRRCFVTKGQAAGVLTGHLEGITFIDSRGDGRYFISNGKDQSIKLWDIRKMSSKVTWYTSFGCLCFAFLFPIFLHIFLMFNMNSCDNKGQKLEKPIVQLPAFNSMLKENISQVQVWLLSS